MTSSFGARLRQQREERGIALGEIAGQTKIKVSLLEGLERDDLSHWPPGIFRRAYLRSYAIAIGLNPDTVVADFLTVYPERPEVIEPGVAADGSPAAQNGGAQTRLRHLVGSAVGSLSRLRRGSIVENQPRPQGTTGSAVTLSLNTPPPARPAPPPAVEIDRDEVVSVIETAPDHESLQTDDVVEPSMAVAEPAEQSPIEAPAAASPAPAIVPTVDLLGAAELCTSFGRVDNANQLPELLREAARILGARGLIVWVWDAIADELQPVLVYGYPDKLVAQLPQLKTDADNLTAASFRSAETLALGGNAEVSAALAVPLLIPGACAGVLAIELPAGSEEADPIRALATIFAAMLAQLVGAPASASQHVPGDGERPAMSTAV